MKAEKYEEVVAILGIPDTSMSGQPPCADDTAIFAWWTPVIDRTLADCVYGNPKGCIDQVLLNRLESNIEYIQYRLDRYNCVVDTVKLNSNAWTRKSYLLAADVARIYNNLAVLRNSGVIFEDTPIPQKILSYEMPGYEVINQWERILYDIKIMLDAIQRSWLYTAQPLLHCGFAVYTLGTTNK